METRLLAVVSVLILASSALGGDVEIVAFESTGQLSWTNSHTGGTYRVEWSSDLVAGWQTNSPFEPFPATSQVMTAEVPMAFRVAWTKPTFDIGGAVLYSTNSIPTHGVRLIEWSTWSEIASTTSSPSGTFVFESVPLGNYNLQTAFGPVYKGLINRVDVDRPGSDHVARVEKYFNILSPAGGSTVSTLRPTFTWDGLPEAESYYVELSELPSWDLVEPGSVPTASFQPSSNLTDGMTYNLLVFGYDAFNNRVGYTHSEGYEITVDVP